MVHASSWRCRTEEGIFIEPPKLGCVTMPTCGLPAVPRTLTAGQWARWVNFNGPDPAGMLHKHKPPASEIQGNDVVLRLNQAAHTREHRAVH
jgi:hypothetical protein